MASIIASVHTFEGVNEGAGHGVPQLRVAADGKHDDVLGGRRRQNLAHLNAAIDA